MVQWAELIVQEILMLENGNKFDHQDWLQNFWGFDWINKSINK